jgi:hypothetical protein
VPTDNARREYELTVTLTDEAGQHVATGTLHTLVGPKPKPEPT